MITCTDFVTAFI